MDVGAKGLVIIALLAAVGIWFTWGAGEKTPGGGMEALELPTVAELAGTSAGSPECAAIMKETMEKKMAMQDELQEALAGEDQETLTRLDREISEMDRQVLDVCE